MVSVRASQPFLSDFALLQFLLRIGETSPSRFEGLKDGVAFVHVAHGDPAQERDWRH